MRLSFLISFLLISFLSANAQTIQVSGEVSGTWDADTVKVTDHIIVPDNQSLIIEPGVKVVFDGYFRFEIVGQIQALGLEGDSISFLVLDTTDLHSLENTKGGWAGFWFEPITTSNDSSIFEYCRFNYGKAVSTDTNYWHGGAVSVWKYSQLRFSNCTFANNVAHKNGGAVYCKSAHIKIDNCQFIDNTGGNDIDWGYGGGICLEYSDAKIYHNYFTRNTSTGVGGGLSFEYSNPDIEFNIFYDNFSAIGGGLCGLRSEKGHSIVNNLFEANGSTFFGGGVAFLNAHSLFTNNTVVNNLSVYGGGLYFNDAVKTVVKNNIVWNNVSAGPEGLQVWVYDVNSAPEFYYNNIAGGYDNIGGSGMDDFLGVYENNIDIDPLFTSTEETIYGLSETSPCINSGTPDTLGLLLPLTDLAGNIRFKDERIDMGCYEFQGNSNTHQISFDNNDLNVSPNPIRDIAIFQINTDNLSAKAELRIINSNGKLVRSFNINKRSSFTWDGTDTSGNKLPSGIYLYQIIDSNSTFTKKLVLQ